MNIWQERSKQDVRSVVARASAVLRAHGFERLTLPSICKATRAEQAAKKKE